MAMLDASLDGLPFLVESTETEGGQQNAHHEFAGTDYGYSEPMGQRTKRFTVEAVFVGPGYQKGLQDFEDLLDRPGDKSLVHPYRGSKSVALDGPWRTRQSTERGGMATVSMAFMEAGPALAPTKQVDTAAAVKADATALNTAVQDMAPDVVDTDGPAFLTEAIETLLTGVDGVTDTISDIRAEVASKFAMVDTVATAVEDFTSEAEGLINTPWVIASQIQGLLNTIMSSIATLGNTPYRGDEANDAARIASAESYMLSSGTFSDGLGTVSETTPSRTKQRKNQDFIADAMELAGLTEGMRAFADLTFETVDQANALAITITDIIDRVEERGSADDNVGSKLRSLRTSFINHLRRVTVDLSGLGSHTPPVTTSTLELAYYLFGDATLADELAYRNRIEHPGFVHGGVALAVPGA